MRAFAVEELDAVVAFPPTSGWGRVTVPSRWGPRSAQRLHSSSAVSGGSPLSPVISVGYFGEGGADAAAAYGVVDVGWQADGFPATRSLPVRIGFRHSAGG